MPLRPASAAARLVIAVGSPVAFMSFAAPLASAALWAAATGVAPRDLLGATAVRVWGALTTATLVAAFARAIADRRWAHALFVLAAVTSAAHAALWSAWHFYAETDAGEQEAYPPWRRIETGPRAAPPSVEVLDVSREAGSVVHARVGSREIWLAPGRAVPVGGGSTAQVDAVGPAPAFEVRGPGGELVAQGIVKLAPHERGFIEVGFLPHRFYLSFSQSPGAAPTAIPETLRLRVQRGKIRVFSGDVAKGATASFEGLTFAFGDGVAWARVGVRGGPPPALLIAGAVLVLGGLALSAHAGRVARRR